MNVKKEIKQKIKKEPPKIDINEIQNLEDIKKYIRYLDKDAKIERVYFNAFANFILNHRNERIKSEEFFKNIIHKSRQSIYNLIHDFQKWGFIDDAGHSYWKIDF